MTTNLQTLITTTTLTPTEQLIANYVFDHLQECCFLTSTELSKQLDVSYSSVIRLTRTFGFSGFTEFQSFLRTEYSENLESINETITIPSERLTKSMEKHTLAKVEEVVTSHVLDNIQQAILNNPASLFEDTCQTIINSNLKYVLASRAGYCVADFLSVIMKQIVPHVFPYSQHSQNVFDFMNDISSQDCLIVIAYERYSKINILATEMAYNQGAQIILITNKATSPLAKYAKHLFIVKANSDAFYNSYVATLYIAELLCAYLSKATNYSNHETLKQIDHYTSILGNF